MRVCFARHGESQVNIVREISNHGLRYGLTRKGRQQAIGLAERFRGMPIMRIYSSPLLRAIETSVILANQLDTDYEVVGALREYDCGVLEGRSDEAAWQLWQELADAWLEDKQWERRIEGGESCYGVQSRFVGFIDNLVREYKDTEANLLCVGHGGLYWMALPLVLNNVNTKFISEQHGFGYATLIVSEWSPEGLVCREWNGIGIDTDGQG